MSTVFNRYKGDVFMFNWRVLFKDKKRSLVISLMMVDFILTYLGVHLNIINEANPFLVWLFELPFLASLTLRLIHVGGVLLGLECLKTKKYKGYSKVVTFALIINLILLILHVRWLLIWLMSSNLCCVLSDFS